MKVLAVVFLVFNFIKLSLGSYGDSEPTFLICLNNCVTYQCNESYQQSILMDLFLWDCRSNCQYTCMHQIVEEKKKMKIKIPQYYGKWPFVRIFGMQEIASVVFSLANLYAHVKGYKLLQDVSRFWFMLPLYRWNLFINVNTWIWSALYHSRDLVLLERMDYFSAALTLAFALFYSIVRVFRITSAFNQVLVAIPLFVFYLYHISYLTFVRFDYGYNMLACVILGLLFNAVWFVWAIINHKRHYAKFAFFFVIGSVLASSLELLDFPPVLDIFDAHSLWHAATVPLITIWYRFLALDGLTETKLQTIN